MIDFNKFRTELEEKNGLWDNIHAKRRRIKNGSGEKMRKPGSKDAPTDQDFKDSQKESVEEACGSRKAYKKEGLDIQEISLDMLTKKVSNSGMATTKKAYKMDKTKADLKALRDRLNKNKPLTLAKEAKEDDEPASRDEGGMAMKQLEFIEYAAEEIEEHIESGKSFPEWMQNRLTKAHTIIESLHSSLGDHGGDEDEDEDKEKMDEGVHYDMEQKHNKLAGKYLSKNNMSQARDHRDAASMHRTAAGHEKSKSGEFKRSSKAANAMSARPALAKDLSSMKEETQLDEISKKTLGSYVKKASADVARREADNARAYAKGDRPVGVNKKAVKNMKRTQYVDKAVDKLTQEAVVSADRKPEKYTKPDGKIGIRMARVDKNVVDKDS